MDWLSYGAREYDPAIGRFMTIDRFAEKYTSMTPYQYGANNPIKFIDVNGDSIVIKVDNNNEAYYDGGNLYNRDGTAYTGKGVKIRKDGSIRLKGFLRKTVNALSDIENGGSNGAELVNSLERNSQTIKIEKGNNSFDARGGNRTVNWDPSDGDGGLDVNGNTSRPSYIGLAHELAHALDAVDDGRLTPGRWFTVAFRPISNAENFASYWENRIRAENGVPLREYYTTTPFNNARLVNGTTALQSYPSIGVVAPLPAIRINRVTPNPVTIRP